MSDNLFEKASRMKLRFASSAGVLSVEDLWDLPLTSKTGKANLDDVARMYSRELKSQEEESFVTKPAKKDRILALGFEIVKHVIEVRLEENEASKKSVERKAEREKLLGILVSKKDDALKDLSVKELEKKLDAMG